MLTKIRNKDIYIPRTRFPSELLVCFTVLFRGYPVCIHEKSLILFLSQSKTIPSYV